LISSSLGSNSGLTAFGSGAAPDEDDRSDDGTISESQLESWKESTLGSNHKIPCDDIDCFWVDDKFIGTAINLRIPSLNSIQRCLRTKRL